MTAAASAFETTRAANTRHPFSVTTSLRDDTARVELRGELDIDGLPALTRALEQLPPHAELEFDCTKLTFLDGAGLGSLIEQGHRLSTPPRLCNPSPRVRRLLQLTDSQQLFSLVEAGAVKGNAGG
jgi:anti-anti-sigma factor